MADTRPVASALVELGRASLTNSANTHAALRQSTEHLVDRYAAVREEIAGPARFAAATAGCSLHETLAEIDAIDETTLELHALVKQLDARVGKLETQLSRAR